MKIVCIYHSIDLDGWMSAAIVKRWYEEHVKIGKFNALDSLEFIGYNHGEKVPNLDGYDKVILCDMSFKDEEIMNGLYDRLGENFVWVDHHISIISNPKIKENLMNGLRDVTFAACELTWKFFFPNERLPEIVRLLGRYDCFGHKGTEEELKVLQFQYGARTIIDDYEKAYHYLNRVITDDFGKYSITRDLTTSFILNKGVIVYEYLKLIAKQIYQNGFEIILKGDNTEDKFGGKFFIPRKFLCINSERFNPSNFGIDYHKDGYDGIASFHRIKDGKWSFSLYNENGEVDCSKLANQFGGGGHKGAAGFISNDLSLLNILNSQL